MYWIYVHGFNSAGYGNKVDALRAFYGAESVLNPTLPVDPAEAMAFLRALISRLPQSEIFLLGSSLGGFYSLNLALEFPVRAVLINPALQNVAGGLRQYLGTLKNCKTQESYAWTQAELNALLELELNAEKVRAASSRILAYLDQDDEVLPTAEHAALLESWQISSQVFSGGNHQFQHMQEALGDLNQRLAAGRF
ncbi:esterase [bacterium (Candidatus Blackallbacteria) CG17_big_fil_post_rev_8_21_14_2_50_48_46]|uniref:Esterase n=1 Tax=bacterium (Candidatus Blackallbacteria) CG17_big_fil_post_rev_8_21_14_2_50_48_46 TaxID=2014261 RepID=A0A2M7G689_9BACT|nr:MAG: esterase [bacterium (Candidatus Blackallbacteria) CG18_big_fil_WC_8_21_14_2_50_49_26]PIW17540.1 MAG: esterase [bacterium (Candidatus Blackallbacteria) CG17_big_fil_post_rev_8_21_14_2_50_48_46]PIW48395.1 MAG: esterase [bacterium (Candidatus Blackallbacteria) CG13_big_fil_rev_8_21_14_2_50_49_14]